MRPSLRRKSRRGILSSACGLTTPAIRAQRPRSDSANLGGAFVGRSPPMRVLDVDGQEATIRDYGGHT
jgi:hypothetical protein